MRSPISKNTSVRAAALMIVLLLTGLAAGRGSAQSSTGAGAALPTAYRLNGVTHIYQGWNNCGPATLTMGLTFFGLGSDQNVAANWLKPNGEDKNVSPWQMVTYVNDVLNTHVRALVRQGGTFDHLRTLIAHDFPVLIEAGYDPEGLNLGWMGHYLLVIGYDDAAQTFLTMDSFDGPDLAYTYDHVRTYWSHFNNVFIVLYDIRDEAEVLALLGSDADVRTNWVNALERARAATIADPNNAFNWFNMGTNFVGLGMYPEAATAYDQARSIGLPWRMLWYQFGPFEAYLAVGRYQDVITLAQANLNDGGGQFVEETYYYAALAREAMGERDRALNNLNGAISFNPNFTPAVEARDRLLAGG